jgi:flagellar biosynthesis/type III secretory pathway M-ring protein FliF/YscJ
MPQQKPVEIIDQKIRFKKNQWNTEGKILVGSLISLLVIGLIAFIVWRKRKK